MGAGAIYIDGIHVDKCGLDGGNFVLFGKSRAEISNCVSTNARTRGIWIIIQSHVIIHDTDVSGSKKFGIDLDADAEPLTVIYRTKVHNNGYQGLFIEQGAQFSVLTDNDLTDNQNGVSFYNNDYDELVRDHVVLNNLCYNNRRTGINIGSRSISYPDNYFPSINSYMIGNIVWNNYLEKNNQQELARTGWESNGQAYGMVMLGNGDNDFPGKYL